MALFNLITWNIQWGRGCDGVVNLRRIVDTARGFADFDVLCMQEVARNFPGIPGAGGEDQFRRLAELLPGYAAVEGVGTDVRAANGAPASREQGSRLRDATGRESGAAPSSAGVASVSGVTSPKGARRRAEEGPLWGSDPADAHRAGSDAPMAGSTVASPQVGPLLRVTPAPVPPSDGARSQFGNMILTRLPVLQAFRHLLPWPAEPEVPSMQRVAVETVLQAPWGLVRVTTTHLEYYSAKQRAAQVERLRELQAEAAAHAQDLDHSRKEGGPFQYAPRPGSAILTADFNFRPDDPLHARLQAPLGDGAPRYVDAWQIGHPGEPHAPTNGVFDREQWPEPYACDFIFVTEDLAGRVREVRVISDTDASDHQPLLLSLDGN
ncbi:MAG: endonuclease/exonuclease/phosphatase family protein [Betaproteobacteria bacterium]|nr:endonuclease/exonuclease/phosphatase family protein [Betaproteobacteria bacterium]